ncbi:rna-directed dna polymerase from mobile element jockey-like [Limosa lapponica baueri]|uniref:Rna-directed dna polymerase from mobile element jockey-like n=1 Tax=Limosa lapponica baueri TaxID=1758121 RepID=A0A2I0URN9_LIMLA|nr:rna-directed dna polymerase from mobile element jockey-like [Limosa lapponica baueri]
MDFRRADFGLFKSLLNRVPWEAALKGKGVQEGWTFFKEEVLKVQEQPVTRESPSSIGCGSRVGCFLSTQTPELADKGGEQNEASVIQREVVRDLLQHLDIHKSMWPDGIQPKVQRELAEVLTEPLSIIYQQSWQTGEVPADWHLANVTLMQSMKDTQVIRPSQHRLMRGRSCLTNLISFCDYVTHLVDEGKAVDVVYLDFSKAFDTASHSIVLEKMAAHGLDGSTLRWVKNWRARPRE